MLPTPIPWFFTLKLNEPWIPYKLQFTCLLSRTREPQEQRLKRKFKSNFQTRNKTKLCDSKTKTQNLRTKTQDVHYKCEDKFLLC